MWKWDVVRSCGQLLYDVDLYYNGSLIAIFTTINIVTIVQLKLKGQKTVVNRTDAAEIKEAEIRSKREFKFTMQSCCVPHELGPNSSADEYRPLTGFRSERGI
ncbi:hypothetical protein COOONC_05197 [Cooperia oncophora]